MKKAIVILHGGIHSTTALATAKSREFELYALSFDYGQKNRVKLDAAIKIAEKFEVRSAVGAGPTVTVTLEMSAALPGPLQVSP